MAAQCVSEEEMKVTGTGYMEAASEGKHEEEVQWRTSSATSTSCSRTWCGLPPAAPACGRFGLVGGLTVPALPSLLLQSWLWCPRPWRVHCCAIKVVVTSQSRLQTLRTIASKVVVLAALSVHVRIGRGYSSCRDLGRRSSKLYLRRQGRRRKARGVGDAGVGKRRPEWEERRRRFQQWGTWKRRTESMGRLAAPLARLPWLVRCTPSAAS